MKIFPQILCFVCFALIQFGLAPVQAQTTPPAVPAEYTSLYSTMQSDLGAFNQTLNAAWTAPKTSMQFAGELYPATSLGGTKTPSSYYLQDTIIPYINSLQAMGVTTIKFSINFPILYQPYYNSTSGANNPSAYQGTLDFYKQVVAAIRSRGMKVVIPTQVVFPFEYPTTTAYFKTLTPAEYTAGRSAVAVTIASQLKPDYLLVQSEPITEVANTPSNISGPLSNLTNDMAMVTTILQNLQNAGLRDKTHLIGAGMGTWQPDFTDYLNALVTLPMDVMDVHVYPVNNVPTYGSYSNNYLTRILQMADAAQAHNMGICMGECWLNKESNSELSYTGNPLVISSRNVYSFWQPLDQQFLLCMTMAGIEKKFAFIDPFDTYCFFAYLDYNQMQPVIAGQTDDEAATTLQDDENTAAYAATNSKTTTSTGNYYSGLIKYGASDAPTAK